MLDPTHWLLHIYAHVQKEQTQFDEQYAHQIAQDVRLLMVCSPVLRLINWH